MTTLLVLSAAKVTTEWEKDGLDLEINRMSDHHKIRDLLTERTVQEQVHELF
jgi:hypothetical protein